MIAVKKKVFYSFHNFTTKDQPETSIIEVNFYNKSNSSAYTSYKELANFNGSLSQSRIKILWNLQNDLQNKLINCGLITNSSDWNTSFNSNVSLA